MDRLRSLLVIYQASIWTAADVHTLLTVEHLGGRLIGVKLKNLTTPTLATVGNGDRDTGLAAQ